MMLGSELPMPSQLLVIATLETQNKKKSIHQYVQTLEENLEEVHQRAQKHLDRGQSKKLEKGKFVWLFKSTKKVKRCEIGERDFQSD